MKKVVTTDYYIEETELKEIISEYFKQQTGKEVNICNIAVDLKYPDSPYESTKFKCVHINVKEEAK